MNPVNISFLFLNFFNINHIHFLQDGFVADKVKKAEKRIEASPFDTEAWSILIRDAQVCIHIVFRPRCSIFSSCSFCITLKVYMLYVIICV